jgi:hypothetical protein
LKGDLPALLQCIQLWVPEQTVVQNEYSAWASADGSALLANAYCSVHCCYMQCVLIHLLALLRSQTPELTPELTEEQKEYLAKAGRWLLASACCFEHCRYVQCALQLSLLCQCLLISMLSAGS